ncbi:MAG: hypothetical protein ACI8RZ_006853 [Myxococcota bacterium]|jgi:hypothetical protein
MLGELSGVTLTGQALREHRLEVGPNGKPPRLLYRLAERVRF